MSTNTTEMNLNKYLAKAVRVFYPSTIKEFTIKYQDYLFVSLSLILIFMELLLKPIKLIWDAQRVWFYLFFFLYFAYVCIYFLDETPGKQGITLFKRTISLTDERNKWLVAILSPIILLISLVIYYFPKIFINIDYLDFHQYFLILIVIGFVLVKFFRYADDTNLRYPDNRTKLVMYLNYAFYFFLPIFLIHDPFHGDTNRTLFSGNLAFETPINFIQNQLLVAFALIIFFGCAGEDLVQYWQENVDNMIKSGLIAFVYLVVELNQLTQNTQTNMFRTLEIIIFTASTLILISSGLTLTTRVRKFGNFAHAEFVTIGLYTAINLKTAYEVQKLIAFEQTGIFGVLVFTFIFTGFCGILGEVLVFSPLDRRDANPLTLMVASIGLGLVIRQTIQEYFGGGDQGAINPKYPLWLKDLRDPLVINFPLIEFCTLIGLIIGIYVAIKKYHGKVNKTYIISLCTFLGWAIGNFIGVLVPPFRPTDTQNPGTSINDWNTQVIKIQIGYIHLNFLRLTPQVIGQPILDKVNFNIGNLTVHGLNIRIKLFDPVDIFVSPDHAWAFLIMLITIFILRIIFTKTVLGISMRATADDEELSLITGINTRRVIYWTWFIAAGVTGIGALYHFEASNVIPASGFRVLLIIFAVVILGGFDSFEGTLISAFIVAAVQSIAIQTNDKLGAWEKTSREIKDLVFWNTRSDWSNVVPFAIIIVVLLFRPRGIFGVVDPRSKL